MKRYTMDWVYQEEEPDGEWVKYEDAAQLQARVKEMEAGLRELMSSVYNGRSHATAYEKAERVLGEQATEKGARL